VEDIKMDQQTTADSVGRLARRLAKEAYTDVFVRLGTTPIAVLVFAIVVPTVVAVFVSLYNTLKEHRPFMDFLASSFVSAPVLITTGVTTLAWVAMYSASIVRVTYRDRTRLFFKTVALKHRVLELREEIHNIRAQASLSLPLSEKDPCVIPRYERSTTTVANTEHPDWLSLHNDGRTEAYDVRIESFQCGDTTLVFPTISLIKANLFHVAKAELYDCNLGKLANKGIELAFQAAWSLHKESREGNKLRCGTRMYYRDRNNDRFRTEFTMVYSSLTKPIEIENIRHSKIPDQPQVQPLHG
jgi:hypothetical protein